MIERVPNGTHTIREVLPAGTICTSPEDCSYSRTFVQPGSSTGNDFGNYANLPPKADDDAAKTDEGKAVEVNVLSNDSDPDGDPLTVESYTQPRHGKVTCTADGRCTYTPDKGTSERTGSPTLSPTGRGHAHR